ncbi:MAG TPA: hypothetical protein VJV23_01520, partial [Candidatus Polarisedimenticolia bacterium]|nr:hypothetical protein [Candidatus Polarisedimenticolia bacterium]
RRPRRAGRCARRAVSDLEVSFSDTNTVPAPPAIGQSSNHDDEIIRCAGSIVLTARDGIG